MTKKLNQKSDLTVTYTGPRGGKWKLIIENFEGDLDIRQKLQDPNFQADWKEVYLDSLYDEQIRQPNEAHHHRYKMTDKTMSTYLYSDTYGDVHHIRNWEGNPTRPLVGATPAFELEIEQREMLADLLCHLNPTQRERVRLYYLCGYNYTEIGKMQGVSPTAVRNSINRGLETIRKKSQVPVQKSSGSCLKGEE